MGALDTAVRQGKTTYVGISSYSAVKTAEAAAILRALGTPFVIHQPSYSLLNRWIEESLLATLEELGIGCIVFSPLAQGLLTNRYLHGIPEGTRAATRGSALWPELLTEETMGKIRALNEMAERRGQSLAQMAIAWTLRDPRVTSSLIGASSVVQLEDSLVARDRLDLTEEELAEIDRWATESDINLWAESSREWPEADGLTSRRTAQAKGQGDFASKQGQLGLPSCNRAQDRMVAWRGSSVGRAHG
jgi:L-glyceraldehyde 3-phosphate reductase